MIGYIETQHPPAKSKIIFVSRKIKSRKFYALGGGILISSKEETRLTLKSEYIEGTEKIVESSSSFMQTRSINKDFMLFFSCLLP